MNSGLLRGGGHHERVSRTGIGIHFDHEVASGRTRWNRYANRSVAPARRYSYEPVEGHRAVSSLRSTKARTVNRNQLIFGRGVHGNAIDGNASNERIRYVEID